MRGKIPDGRFEQQQIKEMFSSQYLIFSSVIYFSLTVVYMMTFLYDARVHGVSK